MIGEPVDHLALALVAPLGADDYDVLGHGFSSCSDCARSTCRRALRARVRIERAPPRAPEALRRRPRPRFAACGSPRRAADRRSAAHEWPPTAPPGAQSTRDRAGPF